MFTPYKLTTKLITFDPNRSKPLLTIPGNHLKKTQLNNNCTTGTAQKIGGPNLNLIIITTVAL